MCELAGCHHAQRWSGDGGGARRVVEEGLRLQLQMARGAPGALGTCDGKGPVSHEGTEMVLTQECVSPWAGCSRTMPGPGWCVPTKGDV